MLFHAVITVRVPHDVSPDVVRELGEREHQRAAELQRQGKWLHLWRVVGKWSNVSVFDVDSPAELHEILESLPLYPFMDVEVTALSPHPGAIPRKLPDDSRQLDENKEIVTASMRYPIAP